MKTFVKMIIGLLIAFAGLYWYYAGKYLGKTILGLSITSWEALKILFVGGFGLCLLFFGILVAWIEYEDWKWEREEKRTKRRKKKK
ncbi:MAG: hypothetical protein B6U68_04240 [Candidatus Aenigmarchaeota archaeon ex4484_14]|nr:MAG: hypothetical protein B6U68_04240 [Candidatus Aenigmarchaeota archaeon ex4484_14]